MNKAEYFEKAKEILAMVWNKIERKTDQYSSGNNALDNIDMASKENGTSPEKTISGMASKHRAMERKWDDHTNENHDWKVFDDRCEVSASCIEGVVRAPGDGIREFLIDSIVYLVLKLVYLDMRIKGKLL